MKHNSQFKQAAAEAAVKAVRSGMVLGLGTGSTVRFALDSIAMGLKKGELHDIVGIPSSLATEKLAQALQIPLTNFASHPRINLTIDGADEVDAALNLIKGGGGALLREKVLAQASERNIIIVDEDKLSALLGERWAVPVEVIPFAGDTVTHQLKTMGAVVNLRLDENHKPYHTDQDNIILDADFGAIDDPASLSRRLNEIAGIVEHGLFINLADRVIVAGKQGIKELKAERAKRDQTTAGRFERLA